jgi:hypothetical protein
MSKATYRVELHHNGEIVLLDRQLEARPHFRTLDPYLSRPARDGTGGWLLLVDEESNKIVARRRVVPLEDPDPSSASESESPPPL